jgi:chitin deacetylase
MRPPFGDIDDRVRAISQQMGLVPALWTQGFDTNDWKINNGASALPGLKAEFEVLVTAARSRNTGFVTLQHDSTAATVGYALDVVLPRARKEGFNLRSLAQCNAV